MIAEIAVGLEHTSNTQKNAQVDEEQPPAKRLKLDFTSGSEEVKKDKSKCVLCVCIHLWSCRTKDNIRTYVGEVGM